MLFRSVASPNSQQENDEMLVPHQELPAAEADTAQPMEGIVCASLSSISLSALLEPDS